MMELRWCGHAPGEQGSWAEAGMKTGLKNVGMWHLARGAHQL